MSLVPLCFQPNVVPLPRQASEKKSLAQKTTHIGSFVLSGTIGAGVCGKVKSAMLHNSDLALKVMKKDAAPLETIQREVALQTKCHDHDNIVTCFDFVETKTKYAVAMELAHCDLFDFVQKAPQAVSITTVKEITFQLLSAVAHMHSKGVCHRDIKPENILMLPNKRIGLTDFGFAMEWSEDDGLQSSSAGTVRCLPPEMFVQDEARGVRQYNPKKLDMWGVGVVLFYMLTGRFPFDCATPYDTALAVVEGKSAPLPANVPSDARDLLSRLMSSDADSRPSARAALHHPFIRVAASHRSL